MRAIRGVLFRGNNDKRLDTAEGGAMRPSETKREREKEREGELYFEKWR